MFIHARLSEFLWNNRASKCVYSNKRQQAENENEMMDKKETLLSPVAERYGRMTMKMLGVVMRGYQSIGRRENLADERTTM